jgi:hypothetical protein
LGCPIVKGGGCHQRKEQRKECQSGQCGSLLQARQTSQLRRLDDYDNAGPDGVRDRARAGQVVTTSVAVDRQWQQPAGACLDVPRGRNGAQLIRQAGPPFPRPQAARSPHEEPGGVDVTGGVDTCTAPVLGGCLHSQAARRGLRTLVADLSLGVVLGRRWRHRAGPGGSAVPDAEQSVGPPSR